MKLELLKKLNENVREKDDFEKALAEAGIELTGDDDLEFDTSDDDIEIGGDSELERIADHWREAGEGMDDDEIRDAIGDELEQLEYSPEEISAGIDTVMAMIGREDETDDVDMDMDMDMDADDELDVSLDVDDETFSSDRDF